MTRQEMIEKAVREFAEKLKNVVILITVLRTESGIDMYLYPTSTNY